MKDKNNYDDNIGYYKRRYAIAFYKKTVDGMGEKLVECFDNPIDICNYKGLPVTEKNLAPIKVELYRALKRFPSTTRMLDGSSMTVHLIDMLVDDSEIERLEQERRDRCMASMKAYVQITSSVNLEVYGSLEAIQVVNASSQTGNRFNAKSGWAKNRVMLTVGTSWYPSEITKWPTVIKLAEKEVITIGKDSDEIKNPDVAAKAKAMKDSLARARKDLERERAKVNGTIVNSSKKVEEDEDDDADEVPAEVVETKSKSKAKPKPVPVE